MLALQQRKGSLEKCSPNILPCRISYNGPSKVTKRFWSPSTEKDKTRTAYFRGRLLRGRSVELPESYEGIIANSTDPVVSRKSASKVLPMEEESDSEGIEGEEASEPTRVLEAVATFDEVIVWGHDQVPAADDTFVKGIEEWIGFAEAINSVPNGQEPMNKPSS